MKLKGPSKKSISYGECSLRNEYAEQTNVEDDLMEISNVGEFDESLVSEINASTAESEDGMDESVSDDVEVDVSTDREDSVDNKAAKRQKLISQLKE